MMRINDKNLCSFATSKTPVDQEGWLGKRGELHKSFQRRWFVLKGNLLFYFEKKEDKDPIGVIILEGGAVELAENEDVHAFKLVFHGAGCRTYILCANDQDSMEEWMKALATATYDYMKLMVDELQRQLDDIVTQEKQAEEDLQNHFQGLTSNSSDGCLCAKVQRFNPFDEWKPHVCENSNVQSSANLSNSEGDLTRQSAATGSTLTRQKYQFLELHEYYGQIFRRVFEENRKRKAAEQQLIVFD